MRERLNKFRERVGGNITIFLYSCSLLIYPLVLIPVTFYYLYKQEWKLAFTSLMFSVVMVALARLMFYFLHWWFKKVDQGFDWLRSKLVKSVGGKS